MDSIQAISSFFVTFAQVCGVFAVWTVAAFVVAARREAAIMAGLSWTVGNAVAADHLARWTVPDVSAYLESDDSDIPDLTADLEEVTVSYEIRIAKDSRPYVVALVKGKRAEIVCWFARGEINTAIEMCEILNG